MFELLEGRPPWQANSEKDLREVIKAEPKFRTVKCLQLQEIIRGCLRHDPSVRLAANDVLTQLEGVMGGATSVTGSIMGVRSVAGCL
jgi:serine/threonine protein kinase